MVAVAPVPSVMAPVAVMAVAPVTAVMPPMAVMVMAVTPVAGMVTVAEMVVLPLHRLDRRLRGESRFRSRRERGSVGGARAEQATGHQGQCSEGEAGSTPQGCVRHRVTSVHQAVPTALTTKLGAGG
ncbi:hypothetical protein BK022_23055 [Methylorubrum extorquens]|uniref:Uncharacterized protein n=1 Tax=Methylorubrum extorquens TaxID=408 RepID=A0A1S1P154_METEX|nr:hypothetical protein BK022_23055 [Methylorubrum extorquens]